MWNPSSVDAPAGRTLDYVGASFKAQVFLPVEGDNGTASLLRPQ